MVNNFNYIGIHIHTKMVKYARKFKTEFKNARNVYYGKSNSILGKAQKQTL